MSIQKLYHFRKRFRKRKRQFSFESQRIFMTSVSKSSSLSLQSSRNILVFNAFCFDLIVLTALMTYCKEIFSSSLIHLATKCCLRTTQCIAKVAGHSFFSISMNPLYLPIMAGAQSVAHYNVF